MKKILLGLSFFLFTPLAFAQTPVCYQVSSAGTPAVNGLYTDTGISFSATAGGGSTYGLNVFTNGTYYLRSINNAAIARICDSATSSCGANGTPFHALYSLDDSSSQGGFDFGGTYPQPVSYLGETGYGITLGTWTSPTPTVVLSTCPSGTTTFEDNISAAYSVYNDTVGTSIGSTTQWATTNLLALFMGSGLALLYYLRSWIVALIIIAAIIYFSYRAFRFFRH